MLHEADVDKWKQSYDWSGVSAPVGKTVGLVLAGNIPLVGFHDIMCVLISGFSCKIKMSSQDRTLLNFVLQELFKIEPGFEPFVEISDDTIKQVDCIIATGSNNTSRYFEYYFGRYPNIIRKNRNSVAVIRGDETSEDFKALGKDIFMYFAIYQNMTLSIGEVCQSPIGPIFQDLSYDFFIFPYCIH